MLQTLWHSSTQNITVFTAIILYPFSPPSFKRAITNGRWFRASKLRIISNIQALL